MTVNMKNRYLILNTEGVPVGHCTCRDVPEAEVWRLEVDHADVPKLRELSRIRLVGSSECCVAVEGEILAWRDNMASVRMIKKLGAEMRQNLRIPVRFESFLYSEGQVPPGRLPIFSFDLSCGGLSFFCAKDLPRGLRAQVVIPVTSQPLLVELEVIRRLSDQGVVPLYAAKFVDLLHEEESMIREAVFGLQFHHASSSGQGANPIRKGTPIR